MKQSGLAVHISWDRQHIFIAHIDHRLVPRDEKGASCLLPLALRLLFLRSSQLASLSRRKAKKLAVLGELMWQKNSNGRGLGIRSIKKKSGGVYSNG
jgi:hypothetical protein